MKTVLLPSDSYSKLDKYVVPTKVSFYKNENEIFKMEIRSIKTLKIKYTI